MSFLTWDLTWTFWDEDSNPIDDPYTARGAYGRWESLVQVWGSGIDALTWGLYVYPTVNGPAGWSFNTVATGLPDGEGYYRVRDGGSGSRRAEPDDAKPSLIRDGTLRWGSLEDAQIRCWVGEWPLPGEPTMESCVQVPEPGTLPLVVTGLLGLACVSRRRKMGSET